VDSYKNGYQLEDVRKLAEAGCIEDPVIVHHRGGFTFYFCVRKDGQLFNNCVLITVKGARPREFKKARTYTRVLKSAGIHRWRVERREE
jgi:hypothetical protein